MRKIKDVMNGFPLPNWFKAGWFVALAAIQVAALYYGLRMSDEKTIHKMELIAKDDSLRAYTLTIQITKVNDKLDRRTNQINTELQLISKRTGYIARKVD